MQEFGILFAFIISLIVSAAFSNAYKAPSYGEDPVCSTAPEADYVWRTILVFGSIPPALTYY
jgi:MFS transporter, PHS family, inorganic phosphate transporter